MAKNKKTARMSATPSKKRNISSDKETKETKDNTNERKLLFTSYQKEFLKENTELALKLIEEKRTEWIKNNPTKLITNKEVDNFYEESNIREFHQIVSDCNVHITRERSKLRKLLADQNAMVETNASKKIDEFREKLLEEMGCEIQCCICQQPFLSSEIVKLPCDHILCFSCERKVRSVLKGPNEETIGLLISRIKCPLCRSEYAWDPKFNQWLPVTDVVPIEELNLIRATTPREREAAVLSMLIREGLIENNFVGEPVNNSIGEAESNPVNDEGSESEEL